MMVGRGQDGRKALVEAPLVPSDDMRTLIVLSALQIAAIGFLATRIVALERGGPPEPARAPAAAPVEETAAAEGSARVSAGPPAYPDAGEIRLIVRQELASQLGPLLSAPRVAEAAAPPEDPAAEAERAHQFEWVGQEIERYVGLGKISDLEMQLLQGEIAKLDKEGQRKLLGRLVRALNTGELEGRL